MLTKLNKSSSTPSKFKPFRFFIFGFRAPFFTFYVFWICWRRETVNSIIQSMAAVTFALTFLSMFYRKCYFGAAKIISRLLRRPSHQCVSEFVKKIKRLWLRSPDFLYLLGLTSQRHSALISSNSEILQL